MRSLDLISPLPSIGSPIPFNTRPTKPSATGIDKISPVALTKSPSLIWVYSPSKIAPTVSSSKFKVKPIVPPGNSNISEALTFDKPESRAIPSPIEITVPTVSSLALRSNAATSVLSASMIASLDINFFIQQVGHVISLDVQRRYHQIDDHRFAK